VESGVICRYKVNGVIVDVMPTSGDILGFTNTWYPEAFIHAIQIKLIENLSFSIFSATYFSATKLEAFKDRGENDGRFSTDFEDIIFVLNNRQEVWQEIIESDGKLKSFLIMEFNTLFENPCIDEWTRSHLDHSEQQRSAFILGNISALVNN
jgi:hypothetical protein